MKEFFTQNLDALVDNLVLPNISPNQNTYDMFMEENDTYIGNNFKNSDISTRTAAAV